MMFDLGCCSFLYHKLYSFNCNNALLRIIALRQQWADLSDPQTHYKTFRTLILHFAEPWVAAYIPIKYKYKV